MRDAAPLVVPAIPFGFVVGLAATESAMPTPIAALSSVFVFAGAAQIATLTLAGTATFLAVATAALVINARHLMYGAALAPTFRTQPRWVRWLAGFLLIDQVFALADQHRDLEPVAFRRYYITAGLMFWITWQMMTIGGVLIGAVIPDAWQLESAPPIMFIALVVMGVRAVPQAVAGVVGVAVGLATAGFADRTGILVAAAAGVIAGTVVDYVLSARHTAPSQGTRDAVDPSAGRP